MEKQKELSDSRDVLDLLIPDVGQTGNIELLKWNISVGDTFSAGDEICDLVTDKAAFSLEAPNSGILVSQFISNGSIVKSGEIAGRVRIMQTLPFD
ncbi:MAG: lipoyl domain-containing protein [Spirochaetia bacterium]|nr:lipoyl domain-containing protein [Spirochaetia bacterium]